MIKKSVFENDLIVGMQQELRKQAFGETPNLVKAGECLHAAMEILEEIGLQKRADQILDVLHKIANTGEKLDLKMPTLQNLKEYGITAKDLQDFGKGEHNAKVKMNGALRNMGLGEHEIVQFIGKHNVVPEHELKTYEKFMGWMKDPFKIDEGPVQPGQTVTMESVPAVPEDERETLSPGEGLTFQSIAARPGKPHKPKRPDTIHPGLPHNGHVKNLTPQRMIENLMNHGTVFNMTDDGIDVSNANFDPEMAEALGVNNADDLDIDDMLNIDVGEIKEKPTAHHVILPPASEDNVEIDIPKDNKEDNYNIGELRNLFEMDLDDITDNDTLEVSDQEPLEDFEDEVHTADDKDEPEHQRKKLHDHEPLSMRCDSCGKRMALCDCIKPFPQKRVKR